MRKTLLLIIGLFVVLFFFSRCNSEDDIAIPDVSENYELFTQNDITEVECVFSEQTVNGRQWYHGLRKGKEWYSLFDLQTGKLIAEWYGISFSYNGGLIPMFGCDFSIPQLMSNGEYTFWTERILSNTKSFGTQLIYLQTNGQIKYDFILDYSYKPLFLIQEKGWCVQNNNKSNWNLVIFDFVGNIIVENVCYYESYLTGFQNGYLWIGKYDSSTSSLVQESIGTEVFERNRKNHIGYGEYEEYYVEGVFVTQTLSTEWGNGLILDYETSHNGIYYLEKKGHDLFFIKNKKLIEVKCQKLIPYSDLMNWYAGSILYSGNVVSPEGEILYASTSYPKSLVNTYCVSYTEWLTISGYNISKKDLNNGVLWDTLLEFYDRYSNNSRFTYTLTNKSGNIWTYRCDILNYDGSTSQEIFHINIDNGEVIYGG